MATSFPPKDSQKVRVQRCSKTVGCVVFFGLGYLAGTWAGRERYAQLEAGAKAVIDMLRARYAENATSTSYRHRDGTDTATSGSATDRGPPC
jgi:hypothetical protein